MKKVVLVIIILVVSMCSVFAVIANNSFNKEEPVDVSYELKKAKTTDYKSDYKCNRCRCGHRCCREEGVN